MVKSLKHWFLLVSLIVASVGAKASSCTQFSDSLYRALPHLKGNSNFYSLFSRLKTCLKEAGQKEGLTKVNEFLIQAKRNRATQMAAFSMYETYAWLLHQFNLNDSAVSILEESLAYIEKVKEDYEGEALQIVSRRLYDWGFRQKGLEYALNAIPLLEDKKLYRELALAYETIGYVYFHEKFYSKSIGAFSQSLAAHRLISGAIQEDDYYLRIHAYNTLGLAYYELGEFDKALLSYDSCEQAATAINDKFWLGLVNGNRAVIYLDQKDYAKAIPALKMDIKSGQMQKDFDNASVSMQELAMIYIELGNSQLGKIYMDSAVSIASGKRYLKYPRFWLLKAKLESVSGNWREANTALQRSYFLLDSMMKRREKANFVNIENSIQEQQRLSDLRSKEALAQVLDSKVSLQRFVIIAIALMLGLAVGLIIYIVIINRKLAVESNRALAASHAKSEILANVSHEFRTPLNAISGFSELLIGKLENEKYRTYALQINEAGKNLTVLVNDILDLSKAEAGMIELHPEEFNLSAFLLDIEQFFKVTVKRKKLKFEIKVSEQMSESVRADAVRLRQILLNLLSNAFKFTEQGVVSLQVYYGSNNQICFQVDDTGPGIPADEQSLIFNAFVQKKNQNIKYGGTGLGLTISKKLIDLMGGSITLKSEVGKGSSFIVCLPL